jgi:hypothetical protein
MNRGGETGIGFASCHNSTLLCMQDAKGAHRTGSEWAALTIISSSIVAYTLYAMSPNVLTGTLLGLAGAWIGLTIQHCGNHGAMSTNTWVNNAMGLTDDLIGGSSLMWSALPLLLPVAVSQARLDFSVGFVGTQSLL